VTQVSYHLLLNTVTSQQKANKPFAASCKFLVRSIWKRCKLAGRGCTIRSSKRHKRAFRCTM